MTTLTRKQDHIRINLEGDVDANGAGTQLDEYRFVHNALPEMALSEVSTETAVFGKTLAAPLLISCMTGGSDESLRLNATLAEAAGELGFALGLGSGRVALEHPETVASFQVRRHAPGVLLFANLGAVQLNKGIGREECRRLLDALEADALALHLNPLQEGLQVEGDTCFAGLLDRIAELCAALERPVVVKEVGWGLAPDVVRALFDAGVSAVDVAGTGGTSWSAVERLRLGPAWRRRVAAAFSDWGIPTAEAVRGARGAAPDGLVFASGGLRNGIDVAKAIALGAALAGLAGPFLRAAAKDLEQTLELGQELLATLRLTMFCLGARSLPELRDSPRLVHRGVAGVLA